MKESCRIRTIDHVTWVMCIAAYILVADYFSPLCIIRADPDKDRLVQETHLSSSPQEDHFIMIMAKLAMYAAMNPDSYTVTSLEEFPEELLNAISERLQKQGKAANCNEVKLERDRLLGIATGILQKYHMYHLHLAAALMNGPVTTEMIEDIKTVYCDNVTSME